MQQKLTPTFLELIYQGLLKSFWRKKALRRFLRGCHVPETLLATWHEEETKRDFLDRLFEALPRSPQGTGAMLTMARALSEQTGFPDLENWEDSALKIAEARAAVAALKQGVASLDEDQASKKQREHNREVVRKRQAEVRRATVDLEKLTDRLAELARSLGTQRAGYDFQDWFFDLLDHQEVDNRRPYLHQGRQIDGSLTLSGTTYLVELKFTKDSTQPADIDSVLKKVSDKADNTMGIVVSISGYTDVAISEASGPRTPLLLLDYRHIYAVLSGTLSMSDIIERLRRHASQTGESFLPPDRFGRG